MNHLSWNTFFPFAASSAEKGKPIPEDITVPDTMGEQFHLVSEPYAFTPLQLLLLLQDQSNMGAPQL